MPGQPPAGEYGRELPCGPAAAIFAADQAPRGLGMELLHLGPGTAVVQMRVALRTVRWTTEGSPTPGSASRAGAIPARLPADLGCAGRTG